jgi:hypothetical protein
MHQRSECGFASVAQPLSFLAAGFGGVHANAALELSRRLTRRLAERTGEVGLAREFEGQRNMGQRLVPFPEQLFGELKPVRADIVMRKRAHASVCVD